MNFLEQLISEWYQYQGYFVRQNIRVGPRPSGGYDCELDIVAFHPQKNHLIHIEPSSDTATWATREQRYKKKFDAGKKHIPKIFEGLQIPKEIEQRAIFLFGSKTRDFIGGGKVFLVSEYLKEIQSVLKHLSIEKNIVPESFPLIRILQIYITKSDKNFDEELYYYYHNWPAGQNNMIHKGGCPHCNYGLGKRNAAVRGRNGVWIGPFSSSELAADYAHKFLHKNVQKHDCI